jgi:glutathione S-transferase
MKLYYAPGACSLSPHIVMHEAGLHAQTIKADLKAHKLEDGSDYYGRELQGLRAPAGAR